MKKILKGVLRTSIVLQNMFVVGLRICLARFFNAFEL